MCSARSAGDKNDVNALVIYLTTSDRETRGREIQNLGWRADSFAIDTLILCLKGDDPFTVSEAIAALKNIGELAVEPLIAATSDVGIRDKVVLALVNIGPSTVRRLVASLPTAEPVARVGLINALGQIGDNRGIEAVEQLLGDLNDPVRDTAITTLASWTPPPVDALIRIVSDADERMAEGAAKALAGVGGVAIDKLLTKALGKVERDRWNGIRALQRVGAASANALARALETSSPRGRAIIASVLIKLRGSAAPDLVPVLSCRSKPARKAAEMCLRKIGEPATSCLVSALVTQDQKTAAVVRSLLVDIGEPVLDLVIDAIADPARRDNAIRVAAAIGDPAVRKLANSPPALLEALFAEGMGHRPGGALREARTLSGKVSSSVAKPLVEALASSDPRTLSAATNVLEILGESALDLVIGAFQDPTRRDGAIRVAGRLSRVALPKLQTTRPSSTLALVEALRDPHSSAHEEASTLLVTLGTVAIQALAEALADDFRDPLRRDNGIRVATLMAHLGVDAPKTSDPAVINALSQALRDPMGNAHQEAATLLEKVGVAATEPLVEALGDKDPRISSAAINALAGIGEPVFDRVIHAFCDSARRGNAIRVLKRISDRAIPRLVLALAGDDPRTLSAAISTLIEIGEPALDLVIDSFSDEVRRENAIRIVAAICECGAQSRKPSEASRANEAFSSMKEAFAKTGTPMLGVIVDAFLDIENWSGAGQNGNWDANPALIKLRAATPIATRALACSLASHDPTVVMAACILLIRMGYTALDDVQEAFLDDSRRASAIRVLAEIGGPAGARLALVNGPVIPLLLEVIRNAADGLARPAAKLLRMLDATTSLLDANLQIKGEIHGYEDLQVDGTVEGLIRLQDATLTIGTSARIHGDLIAKNIVVRGKVDGTLRACERIEVKKGGSVVGELTTSRLTIEDGSYFEGVVEILKSSE